MSNKSPFPKHFTPQAKLSQDNDWKRTLNFLRVEPYPSNPNKDHHRLKFGATTSEMMFATAQDSTHAEGSERKKKKTIEDLPSETQKEIFKHSSTIDLITLSLVSKHFRDIASEHLYRSFYIVFREDEDLADETPIDALASGLNTFVTSNYDYAQYLRSILLEPLNGGVKNQRAYRQYRYAVSCGKFLNTLLLLTLRKAKSLETFKWDIRVELSRDVFKALHAIDSLQCLSIRMQAGQSLYQAPPPLNISGADVEFGHAMGPVGSSKPLYFSIGNELSKKVEKALKPLLPAIESLPPTLSGFRNLKTLEILDMDTLEYASELKACLGNSSSTLSTLKISFSDELAIKSRKPPPEVTSDDETDQEDEFGNGLPPGPPLPMSLGAADTGNVSKALLAVEEKKKQEGFLAQVFGIGKEEEEEIPEVKKAPVVNKETRLNELRLTFLKALVPVTNRLFSEPKSRDELGPDEAQVLNLIQRFEGMVEFIDKKKETRSTRKSETSESSAAQGAPASSSASMDQSDEKPPVEAKNSDERGLFDEPKSTNKKIDGDSEVSNPDDINVDEPEVQELVLDLGTSTTETASRELEQIESEDKPELSLTSFGPDAALASQVEDLQAIESHVAFHSSTVELINEAASLRKRIEGVKAVIIAGIHNDVDIDHLNKYKADLISLNHDLQHLGTRLERQDNIADDLKRRGTRAELLSGRNDFVGESGSTQMSDYIRATRGLTLTTLAIYLVPIKASVLSRAMDLRVLQSVTLLNVGYQTPFWSLLAREHKVAPVSIRKIYTDNVTVPFLSFVSQLTHLTELILLERAPKAKVETSAAKTTVTMEQIRQTVLRKHAATLKILVLRNEAGKDWDMTIKTAVLLCRRARCLEEFAVSFGVKAMHTLLQLMPGLTSLRALHAIQFRQDDTCLWVCQEFRKFTVDNVSHNPKMKLEYIALDNSLERIVRRKTTPKPKVDIKGKGKDVSRDSNGKPLLTELLGMYPEDSPLGKVVANLNNTSMGSNGLDHILSQDSEDETDADWARGLSGNGLRLETVEGIRFSDVTGVRIFERDVLCGRL